MTNISITSPLEVHTQFTTYTGSDGDKVGWCASANGVHVGVNSTEFAAEEQAVRALVDKLRSYGHNITVHRS